MQDRLANIDAHILAKRYESIPFARELNNEALQKRLKFWKDELLLCFRERKMMLVTVEKLQKLYTRDNGQLVPQCFGRVVVELERDGVLRKLEAHQNGSSIVSMLMSPLKWAFSQESAVLERPREDEVFVVVHVLEALKQEFLEETKDTMFMEKDLRLATRGLCEDAAFFVDELKRTQVLQPMLGVEGGLVIQGTQCSELEKTVFQLHVTMETLLAREKSLSETSAQLRLQIGECIVSNRPRALTLLKRKKMVDNELLKRQEITTNVQKVLLSADSLLHSSKAFSAIKRGTEAMRSVQEESGLSVEAIEEVLGEFAELQGEEERIGDAIGQNVMPDAEVEREYELLLAELEGPDKLEKQLEGLKLSEKKLELPKVEEKEEKKKAEKILLLE